MIERYSIAAAAIIAFVCVVIVLRASHFGGCRLHERQLLIGQAMPIAGCFARR
jgi:hypothetical protein